VYGQMPPQNTHGFEPMATDTSVLATYFAAKPWPHTFLSLLF